MKNIKFIKNSLTIIEYNILFDEFNERILQNLMVYIKEKDFEANVNAIKLLPFKQRLDYQNRFEKWLRSSLITYKTTIKEDARLVQFCQDILQESYLQYLFFIKFFDIIEVPFRKKVPNVEEVVRLALSLPPEKNGLIQSFIERYEQQFFGRGNSYYQKLIERAYVKIEDVGVGGGKRMFVFAENTPPSVVADFLPTDEQIATLNKNARLVYGFMPKVIKDRPRLLQNRWQFTLAIDEIMTKLPADWRKTLHLTVFLELLKITYSNYEASDLVEFIKNHTNY